MGHDRPGAAAPVPGRIYPALASRIAPDDSPQLALAEANALPADVFVATFGGIVEHSPWVAERVAGARPYASVDDLGRAFGDALRAADAAARAGVLRAHPELGAANLERLTRESQGEQRGAALDRLDDATRARLLEVNTAYRERHGFPLVIAVRGHTVESLIAFGASRVDHDTDAELATGVEQVALIAAARVADRVRP